MPKYLNPKSWYLVGVGAVALTLEGARRLLRRRRRGEPVIPEEVSATVEAKTRQAKAKGVEVNARIEEMAEPVIEPVKKAASKTKAKAEEAVEKVGEMAEPVIEPVKEVASKAKAKVEETAEKAEEMAEPVVESVEKAPARVKDAAEEAGDAAEKALKKANGVPAVEFVKARTARVTAPAPKEKDAPPDDLTEIKGIGPTFAKRLVEAGITTFDGVASASPDYLREVTHATVVADPEAWIAQARSM